MEGNDFTVGELVGGSRWKGKYSYSVYKDVYLQGEQKPVMRLHFIDEVHNIEHNCFSTTNLGMEQYLAIVRGVAMERIPFTAMAELLERVGGQ